MNKRFAYELVVGIIGLIAVLLFGEKGLVAFALLIAHPFIGKKKADEREWQLFYKIGNYTAGASVVAAVIIYELSDVIVNGILIGKNWLGLLVAAVLIAHGISGLLILKYR